MHIRGIMTIQYVRNLQPEPDVVVVPGVAGYDLYSERFQLVAEVLFNSHDTSRIMAGMLAKCDR